MLGFVTDPFQKTSDAVGLDSLSCQSTIRHAAEWKTISLARKSKQIRNKDSAYLTETTSSSGAVINQVHERISLMAGFEIVVGDVMLCPQPATSTCKCQRMCQEFEYLFMQ